jgi:hypothetical protein
MTPAISPHDREFIDRLVDTLQRVQRVLSSPTRHDMLRAADGSLVGTVERPISQVEALALRWWPTIARGVVDADDTSASALVVTLSERWVLDRGVTPLDFPMFLIALGEEAARDERFAGRQRLSFRLVAPAPRQVRAIPPKPMRALPPAVEPPPSPSAHRPGRGIPPSFGGGRRSYSVWMPPLSWEEQR